jgi:hypothetical protein
VCASAFTSASSLRRSTRAFRDQSAAWSTGILKKGTRQMSHAPALPDAERARQCVRLPPSARAEMTALPKVDTKCTTPSLIPTVNGNTVRSSST